MKARMTQHWTLIEDIALSLARTMQLFTDT